MTGPVLGSQDSNSSGGCQNRIVGKSRKKIGGFLLFTCSANLGKIPPALTPLAAGRGAAACVGSAIGEILAARHGRPFLRKEC
jgi:hypothetical protein